MKINIGNMAQRSVYIIASLIIISMVVPTASLDFVSSQEVTEILPTEENHGNEIIEELVSQLSGHLVKQHIKELSENGSRPYGSYQNIIARRYIESQLQVLSEGKIDVSILGTHKSVVGRLPGWLDVNAPVLMVGGHLDSVQDAPGANDDGTGVAIVLELARILSKFEWPLDIYFCAWNAEENGLIGSSEVADIFAAQEIEILQYFNVDMLLVEDIEAPPDERILAVYNNGHGVTYHESHYFADLMRMMSNNYGQNLILPLPSTSFGAWTRSDHWSFIVEGYQNTLFAFESGVHRDSAYHQPTDAWDNPMYNYTMTEETALSIGLSIAFTLSRQYDVLTSLEYNGVLQPGESKQYYFAMTTETDFVVNATWNKSEVEFKLVSPNEAEIAGTLKDSSGNSEIILNETLSDWGLYKVLVENTGINELEYTITARYESDVNNDNVPDSQQFWFDDSYWSMDQDADGLVDAIELLLQTSPLLEDSDFDTMPDAYEVQNDLDPLENDAEYDLDQDGLSNLREFELGTNPNSVDSDQDQMDDYWEVQHNLDPLRDDSMEDPDGDFLTNLDEYLLDRDPHLNEDIHIPFLVVGSLIGIVILGLVVKQKRSH
ncbi:MAG: M28 family peptidase [Candidatus Lokiarchaeota archaeon]|nr:M28 family peptidase [Candidatus Lokiarchaeota archaeon]